MLLSYYFQAIYAKKKTDSILGLYNCSNKFMHCSLLLSTGRNASLEKIRVEWLIEERYLFNTPLILPRVNVKHSGTYV